MVFPLELVGDGLTQFHQAEVGGVVDLALRNGLISSLLDILGSIKVGTANFEMEDFLACPLHGQSFFIHFPDSRGCHSVHTSGNMIIHTSYASFLYNRGLSVFQRAFVT